MQYAENQVTRQPTKEAFRATGALPRFGHLQGQASALATLRSMQALTSLGSPAGLPSLVIPEGRTDSPPEGRWSPLTGPCALREPPSKPASGFRGYRSTMQALIGLSQPLGLTSWGISLSAESDRLCCHIPICHPTLRLAVLPLAAHLRHDTTCHWQLAGTTRLGYDEGGERRWQSTICRRKL